MNDKLVPILKEFMNKMSLNDKSVLMKNNIIALKYVLNN